MGKRGKLGMRALIPNKCDSEISTNALDIESLTCKRAKFNDLRLLKSRHSRSKNKRPLLEEPVDIEWESSGSKFVTNSRDSFSSRSFKDLNFINRIDKYPNILPSNCPENRLNQKQMKVLTINFNNKGKKSSPLMEFNQPTCKLSNDQSLEGIQVSCSPDISPPSSPMAPKCIFKCEPDTLPTQKICAHVKPLLKKPKLELFGDMPLSDSWFISDIPNVTPTSADLQTDSDIFSSPSSRDVSNDNYDFSNPNSDSPCEVVREESQSPLFFLNSPEDSQEIISSCSSYIPIKETSTENNIELETENIVLSSISSAKQVSFEQPFHIDETPVRSQIEISTCSSPLISHKFHSSPEGFSSSGSPWWENVMTEDSVVDPKVQTLQTSKKTIEAALLCDSVKKTRRHKLGGLARRLERLERREESFNNLNRYKLGSKKEVSISLKVSAVDRSRNAMLLAHCTEETTSREFTLIIPSFLVQPLSVGCIVTLPYSCQRWELCDSTTILFPTESDLAVKGYPESTYIGPPDKPQVLYQWPV